MTKKNTAALCPELAAILANELAQGNRLKDGPNKADWPEPGSIFAALEFDLRSDPSSFPESVRHSICRDLHYGWHDECYCTIHRHLLVAGETHHP
ncbi:hypothetical protein ACFQ3P_12930 [Paraburkholderia sabiae]|uniref:Uncharacterized protein n=1 Tax=Paraburkholderia sabiae TaxID=273251 RepID=A0ABU9QCN1_9BURK|nr:hypothetical protein [Paraburkholderia sabiae]WJZ76004.1 hypothetical protein QEN71_09470 [Paraburkholderia sabiae]CAD6527568.1 hypothetical protein LMG24235_02075 [Paraburkholderia sabiae]